MDAFINFMTSGWGIAIFTVVALAIVILFFAVNYRIFAKAVLDYIFGAIFLVVCSPVIAVCAIVLKARAGRVFNKVWVAGKNANPVQVHVFASYSAPDGTPCYISRSRLHYLPLLLDIFPARLSLVGPSPLSLKDAALVEEEFDERFSVRPGIFTAASIFFAARPEYESMFRADSEYPAKRSLFTDTRAVVGSFLRAIRGEKSDYLSFDREGYAEELLVSGGITEEQYKELTALAEEQATAARRAPMRVG